MVAKLQKSNWISKTFKIYYTKCGNFIMQNVEISLSRIWEFYYAECGDFIMQIVFFWHKASMYVIEKKQRQ